MRARNVTDPHAAEEPLAVPGVDEICPGTGPHGRGPLHAPEAEVSVISAMLRDPSCIAKVVAQLRANNFSAPLRPVFEAAVRLGDQLDVMSLAAELRAAGVSEATGGKARIVEILETEPHAAHVDRAIGLVLEAAVRRAAIEHARRLERAAHDTTAEFDAAKSAVASFVSSASFASDIDDPIQLAPWPTALESDELYGVAGDFVRVVSPHTESDPAALYFQFLVAFGNLVGRQSYFQVEATRHHANTNVVIVGRTSKGRKGTAWGHVVRVLGAVDRRWADERIQDGLGSGEGLIWAVRDHIERTEPVRSKGRVIDYQQVMSDAGIADKRLLIAATEFSSPMRVACRDGNTLSPVIRNAWDTGMLRVVVKNTPATATGAHISILGHITKQELLAHLNDVEAANGFGNRFLWVASERSKVLADGGSVPENELDRLQQEIASIVERTRGFSTLTRDADAQKLWRETYPILSEGKAGLLGAILGRAEAQVTRLSLIFALLDGSCVIRAVHLKAALSAWKYVGQSAAFIFGATLGNPTADEILARLREAQGGLKKGEIHRLFGNHRSKEEISRALTLLYDSGLAHRVIEATSGRSAERWFAGRAPAKEANKEKEGSEDSHLRSLRSHLSQGESDRTEETARLAEMQTAPVPDTADAEENRRERLAIQEANGLPPAIRSAIDTMELDGGPCPPRCPVHGKEDAA